MEEDSEGFLYPNINLTKCINCHLCEKICPVLNQNNENKPLAIYAAKNINQEIRIKSSSGGVFSIFAEQILEKGGIVFGARYDDNWDVVHDFIESKDDLKLLRGSKYTQSRIDESYIRVKNNLKEGRLVLFSGTPCQVAGLNSFLRKKYDNLITIDFVCHGVPSPKVWRLYRKHFLQRIANDRNLKDSELRINDIQFRNKKNGWKNFCFQVNLETHINKEILINEVFSNNLFMKGFLNDLYLRPSCHACPSKNFKSNSDVTLADYWGIQNFYPEFDDDQGVSLLLVNKKTIRVKEMYSTFNDKLNLLPSSYGEAVVGNSAMIKSVLPHKNRQLFFKNLDVIEFDVLINKCLKVTYFDRLYSLLKRKCFIIKKNI